MGPIDYLVVEFPHRKAPGEGLPIFVDLVDCGIIRALDATEDNAAAGEHREGGRGADGPQRV